MRKYLGMTVGTHFYQAWKLAPTTTRHGSWISLGRIVPGILLLGVGVGKNHVAISLFSNNNNDSTIFLHGNLRGFFFFIGDRQQPTNTDHGNLRSLRYQLHYGLPLPFSPLPFSPPLVHLAVHLFRDRFGPTDQHRPWESTNLRYATLHYSR